MRVRKIGLRLRRTRQPIMWKIIVRMTTRRVLRKKREDRRAVKLSQRKQVTWAGKNASLFFAISQNFAG